MKNLPINLTIPIGDTHEQMFPKTETLPVRISCSIHSWELAWLVVKDHPYMATTDDAGRFKIKDLPAGARKLMFWHEEAGFLQDVTLAGKRQRWERGVAPLERQGEPLDLGEIVVEPKAFRRRCGCCDPSRFDADRRKVALGCRIGMAGNLSEGVPLPLRVSDGYSFSLRHSCLVDIWV